MSSGMLAVEFVFETTARLTDVTECKALNGSAANGCAAMGRANGEVISLAKLKGSIQDLTGSPAAGRFYCVQHE